MPPTSTDLLIAPGQQGAVTEAPLRGQTAVDTDLVAAAVARINELHSSHSLALTCAIGRYVIDTFFGGDPSACHRRGSEHASFRALVARADLSVSASNLWRSVAVVEQLAMLPAEVADALPVSHHKLLLPVKDPEAKVSLATQAAKEHLSKRELAERVAEVTRKGREEKGWARAGRPPDPVFAKGIKRIVGAVGYACAADVATAHIVEFGPGESRLRLDALRAAIGQAQVLVTALEAGIDAAEAIEAAEVAEVGATSVVQAVDVASFTVVDAEESVVAEAVAVVAEVDGELDLGHQTTHPALQALVDDPELQAFLARYSRLGLGRLLPLADKVAATREEAGLSLAKIGEAVGCAYPKMVDLARLVGVPAELRAGVEAGDAEAVGMTQAVALARIKDAKDG